MFETVINFWFEQLTRKQHFVKDPALDAEISEQFTDVYWQVLKGEAEHWRNAPEGRLAEIIVLDQFARNIFRDDPQAFTGDYLALALAQEAIRVGDDLIIPEDRRTFIYMPFMHSESPVVHEAALKLFKGRDDFYKFELKHKEIIDQFGRYPHRNAVLSRQSTPAELEFLKIHSGF